MVQVASLRTGESGQNGLPSTDCGSSAQIYPTKGDVPGFRPDGEAFPGRTESNVKDAVFQVKR